MLAQSILPKVKDAVSKYGNTLTLRQKGTEGTWNPTTQQIEGGTPDVDLPFKAGVEIASVKDIIGNVQQGDLILTAVIEEVEPSVTAKIIYNNREYGIIDINPLYFQDVLMAYQIVGRN